ncbi:MAG: hypothetical protein M1510_07850 [Nitrospirae bacterium]|nr:hypothetical protein [Nitrospirota bacterium]MCL5237703.1 hypothetical protein [Nitrospirota bacterium]
MIRITTLVEIYLPGTGQKGKSDEHIERERTGRHANSVVVPGNREVNSRIRAAKDIS